MAREAVLRHPPGVKKITVHASAPERKYGILSILVALHAVTIGFCMNTKGQAKEIAMKKRAKETREHFEKNNGTLPPEHKVAQPLPWDWQPNPWASVSLFGSISLHILFYLACHWKVSFRAAALYKPHRRMKEGCMVQVTPHAHRGKAALAPVVYSELTDKLVFEFQRQRYEFTDAENMAATDDTDGKDFIGEVKLVSSPVDLSIPQYFKHPGLRDQENMLDLKEMYGENCLNVSLPSFMEMYVERLLSPLVIYQFFVALLWAFDDFWNYTIMQVITLGAFEVFSVFQQRSAQKMLSKMGSNKAFIVMAYREKRWQETWTTDLLPGDIIQLSIEKSTGGQDSTTTGDKPAADDAPKAATAESASGKDIVPCDCVILRGEAVVNEASLTGESVPQMKDALIHEERTLDISGADKVHTLMSGTRLLRATEGRAREEGETSHDAELPQVPDGGCLCYVLRTGFSSAQGELLQMIEFSMEKVAPQSREVIVALLLLSVVALIAAGYVLKVGLERGEKTHHELLVKCILILSSVVPRGMPMQTAIAVNTALMALRKEGVYCIEPHRVPVAGKLSHCFFDKTGTLTTDTLVPNGVVNTGSSPEAEPLDTEVPDARPEAALVLATCHSLVCIDGKLSGDPIELAAIEGVKWRYDAADDTSRPGNSEAMEASKAALEAEIQRLALAGPALQEQQEEKRKTLEEVKQGIVDEHARAERYPVASACILKRFHFSSKLQRMSVVARTEMRSGDGAETTEVAEGSGQYILVKGSPEAMHSLLLPATAPPWYHKKHTELSERGLRLLALALRKLPEDVDVGALQREEVEKDLTFVGFIMFECKLRSDSKLVIDSLTSSDHKVSILTGDAPLTALHVARHCGFSSPERPALVLKLVESVGAEARPVWCIATGDRRGEERALTSSMSDLAKDFTLLATQDSLEAAGQEHPEIWDNLDLLSVYARMTPQGKAKIIRQLQKHGKHVLMCGDGGNDVGALKQADVSLALLGGYENVNTLDEVSNGKEEDAKKGAEDSLNDRQKALAKRKKEVQKLRAKFLKEKQVELQARQKIWLEEEVHKMEINGKTGIIAQGMAAKHSLWRYTSELQAALKEFDIQNGNVYDAKAATKASIADTTSAMNTVSPGDASTAAAFTSRAPSIKHCVDIIRQGRCTLLGTLQTQQIMMLNCIISAFCMSVISLEGARSSERQLMVTNWLTSTAAMAFSYATPVQKMHPVRPLRSLFQPAVFVSMLGQAAIHLLCLRYAVLWAREAMEAGSAAREAGWIGPSLEDVREFWRIEKLKRAGHIKDPNPPEEKDYVAMAWEMWEQPFLPNLMNTVVFYIEQAQSAAVLVVNYKGQPWMKGLLENRPLFFSSTLLIGGLVLAVYEANPQINGLIHLSPFPSDEFRRDIIILVGFTLAGTFIWDRICIAIFSPDIMGAQLRSLAATTFENDAVPMFVTLGKVILGLIALGSGNILLIGGFGYMYWKYKNED